MNTHEQRVREFAYQIWESEGRPAGHEYRHWQMACKLAETQDEDDPVEKVTGNIPSTIAPEEPFNPEPAPEIDPAPPQPGQPTPPAHPNVPPHPNVPVDPISPTEPPPHISPTLPPQPIHPTDPVQPGNPTQPIQPYASKRTSAATKSALNKDGVKPAEEKKQTRSRKAGSTKNQDSMGL